MYTRFVPKAAGSERSKLQQFCREGPPYSLESFSDGSSLINPVVQILPFGKQVDMVNGFLCASFRIARFLEATVLSHVIGKAPVNILLSILHNKRGRNKTHLCR